MLKPLDHELGLISDSVLERIEDMYSFNIEKVYPFANINNYPVALNKRSETSRKLIVKVKNQLFILKEIPWYVDNYSQIEMILKSQQYIFQNLCMAPNILKNKNGELYSVIYNRTYFIQTYIVGNSWTYSEKQSFEMGRSLKRIHKLRVDNTFGIISSNKDLIANCEGILNLLTKKYKGTRNLMFEDEKKLFLEMISTSNLILREKISKLKNMNYGAVKSLVHGDYNPNNITFNEDDTVKGVYDFDNITFDDPLHDIAEGLIDVSLINYKNLSSRFYSISSTPSIERFRAFINGYMGNERDKRIYQLIPSCITLIIIEFICLGVLRNDWSIQQGLYYLKNLVDLEKNVEHLLKEDNL